MYFEAASQYFVKFGHVFFWNAGGQADRQTDIQTRSSQNFAPLPGSDKNNIFSTCFYGLMAHLELMRSTLAFKFHPKSFHYGLSKLSCAASIKTT